MDEISMKVRYGLEGRSYLTVNCWKFLTSRLTESENGSMLEATRTSAAMLHDALLYVKRTNEANALSSPQPAMPDGHKPLLDRPLSDMPALV